jgi:SAM-dependent methyltransferase
LGSIRQSIRTSLLLLGSMRRTYPVSVGFGREDGTPIDRYYIEQFLAENTGTIRGRVLEVGDREYTTRFGTGVTTSDVVNVLEGAPDTTILADLGDCPQIPEGSFDCIVLIQTLHYTYDMNATVCELHRILAPGGTVLCTVPGISQVSRYDMDRWGDRWRLTSLSAAELFSTAFRPADVSVQTYGNTLSSICLLEGIPAEKLRPRELDVHHEDYQLIVAVRAVKPA